MTDYWREAFLTALEEADIPFPSGDKLNAAVKVIEGAHENYGMAHGYDCIPNPLRTENDALAKQLDRERRKEHCRNCDGRGRVVSHGPIHSCNSQCHKCNGQGWIYP